MLEMISDLRGCFTGVYGEVIHFWGTFASLTRYKCYTR